MTSDLPVSSRVTPHNRAIGAALRSHELSSSSYRGSLKHELGLRAATSKAFATRCSAPRSEVLSRPFCVTATAGDACQYAGDPCRHSASRRLWSESRHKVRTPRPSYRDPGATHLRSASASCFNPLSAVQRCAAENAIGPGSAQVRRPCSKET